MTTDELKDLRSKNTTTNLSPKSRSLPKAFKEKGLYMLATILKNQRATSVTFAIILIMLSSFPLLPILHQILVVIHLSL